MGVSAALTFLFLAALAATQSVLCQRQPISHAGTTANLEDVYVGRCWDYEKTRYKELLPRVTTECSSLWDNFAFGFRYKKPCDVKMSSYAALLESTAQELPRDKVMFWSGVFDLAHRFSHAGRNFVTLEDTMLGYLVNGLVWCGQEAAPGINYDRCPEWTDCELEASESFWAGASDLYARHASGEVTLMLGGSDPTRKAYRRNSFFAKHELPNLSQAVTNIVVLVTHELGKEKVETCTKGSLLDLKEDVEKRGFPYQCIDDPKSVMHLLCADDPSAVECRMMLQHVHGMLPPPEYNRTRLISDKPVDRFNSEY